MTNIQERINLIKGLLQHGNIENLTYAALECRLTIEMICYDRLRISHDYLSDADLGNWRPKQVVEQIIQDANPNAAKGVTLSVSPDSGGAAPTTREEFEALEYIEIGHQSPVDLSSIARLWNKLANVALHTQLPTKASPTPQIYGDIEKIRRAVEDTLAELKKISRGNLLVGYFGSEWHINCDGCSRVIRRKSDLLRQGQVIACQNPECKELYTISVESGGIYATRRIYDIRCRGCGNAVGLPQRYATELKRDSVMKSVCGKCHETTYLGWQFCEIVLTKDTRGGATLSAALPSIDSDDGSPEIVKS